MKRHTATLAWDQKIFRWALRLSAAYLLIFATIYFEATVTASDRFDKATGHTERVEYTVPGKYHWTHVRVYVTPTTDRILSDALLPLYVVAAVGGAFFLWMCFFPQRAYLGGK